MTHLQNYFLEIACKLNLKFILDNECKIMRSEFGRITHEVNDMKLSIKGNADKGKSATILPFSATVGLYSTNLQRQKKNFMKL